MNYTIVNTIVNTNIFTSVITVVMAVVWAIVLLWFLCDFVLRWGVFVWFSCVGLLGGWAVFCLFKFDFYELCI